MPFTSTITRRSTTRWSESCAPHGGFVAGVWRPMDGAIEVTAFHPLPNAAWPGLASEAARLIAFLADRQAGAYSRYGRWWAAMPRGTSAASREQKTNPREQVAVASSNHDDVCFESSLPQNVPADPCNPHCCGRDDGDMRRGSP